MYQADILFQEPMSKKTNSSSFTYSAEIPSLLGIKLSNFHTRGTHGKRNTTGKGAGLSTKSLNEQWQIRIINSDSLQCAHLKHLSFHKLHGFICGLSATPVLKTPRGVGFTLSNVQPTLMISKFWSWILQVQSCYPKDEIAQAQVGAWHVKGFGYLPFNWLS